MPQLSAFGHGRRRAARSLACWVLLALVWLGASGARADDTAPRNPERIPLSAEGHLSLTWSGGLGAGGRLELPIIDSERLYDAHDQLSLSVGGDLIFLDRTGEGQAQWWPTAAIQWSIAVNDGLSFFPELGVAVQIDRKEYQEVVVNAGFGARIRLFRALWLLGRLGYPMALSAGLAF